MKRNIVLIGLSGCGKTTLAPLLSKALEMPFVEMDEEIVKMAQKSIAEIFAEGGEDGFRELEAAVARRCAAMEGVIISTGGGVILRRENMRALSATGLVVFIDRDLKDILGEDLSDRPLVAVDKQKIFRLYDERIGLYRKYGQISVKNAGDITSVAETLIQKIQEAWA